jgi:ABC-type branched-subunit amino acid transport system ATPase component
MTGKANNDTLLAHGIESTESKTRMTQDSLITIEHLSRRFGNNLAVNDVSFSVRRGEVLGFLGPNGAGKTTTMRMLTGNLAPSAGRITIAGIDLLDAAAQAKATHRLPARAATPVPGTHGA